MSPQSIWSCRLVAALAVLVAWSAGPAAAQTKRTPSNPRNTTANGTAGRSALPVASGSVNFPMWLDDTDTLEPGTGSVELSVGRWSAIDGGETYAPVVDATIGVTSSSQLEVVLPHFQASYTDGYRASGLGDASVAFKYQLVDPSEHVIGLSVEPLLEILSTASVSDTTLGLKRANWGLPITLQVGSDDTPMRAYASVGYLSRHAVFAGAAVERDLGKVATFIGALNYAYTTRVPAGSDLLGLSRARTDASGIVYVNISPVVSLFAGAGRTVSKLDQNGARLAASAGIRIEGPLHRRAVP